MTAYTVALALAGCGMFLCALLMLVALATRLPGKWFDVVRTGGIAAALAFLLGGAVAFWLTGLPAVGAVLAALALLAVLAGFDDRGRLWNG